MNKEEQKQFVDLIAQAVIDKIDERERVNRLADLVVERVLALQIQEAESNISTSDKVTAELENERNIDAQNR